LEWDFNIGIQLELISHLRIVFDTEKRTDVGMLMQECKQIFIETGQSVYQNAVDRIFPAQGGKTRSKLIRAGNNHFIRQFYAVFGEFGAKQFQAG